MIIVLSFYLKSYKIKIYDKQTIHQVRLLISLECGVGLRAAACKNRELHFSDHSVEGNIELQLISVTLAY